MILTFFPDLPMRVICSQLGDSEVAATAPEEEKHESAVGPVHQPMEGGLSSDDEEVLLPYGKELRSSESTVLPVHHSLPPPPLLRIYFKPSSMPFSSPGPSFRHQLNCHSTSSREAVYAWES